MLLEGKLFVTKQDKASKDTFLLILSIFQSYLGIVNRLSKIKNCHTDGDVGFKKVPKKCHMLFEWLQI